MLRLLSASVLCFLLFSPWVNAGQASATVLVRVYISGQSIKNSHCKGPAVQGYCKAAVEDVHSQMAPAPATTATEDLVSEVNIVYF